MTIAAGAEAIGASEATGSSMSAGELMGVAQASNITQLAGNILTNAIQNDANTKMWNRQNEYNLPVNQVLRLRQASLNPALLYGHGNLANTAAPVQRVEKIDFPNPMDNIAATQQVMMSTDTARAVRAQAIEAEMKAANAVRDFGILVDTEEKTGIAMRSTDTGVEPKFLQSVAGVRDKVTDKISDFLGNAAEGAGKFISGLFNHPVSATDRARMQAADLERESIEWLKNQK